MNRTKIIVIAKSTTVMDEIVLYKYPLFPHQVQSRDFMIETMNMSPLQQELLCDYAECSITEYPPFLYYLCFSFINIFLLNISGHSKVRHLALFVFSNQHVTGCKVSVDDLKEWIVKEGRISN